MKGKLIIVEGVDGSGKTTLIEGLKTRMQVDHVFNYSYPKETTPEENVSFARGEYLASIKIFKALVGDGKTIICDRFHLGEYAYGPIMRGYSEFLAESILNIEGEINEIKKVGEVYLVILVVYEPKILMGRLQKKKLKMSGEYLRTSSQLSFVNARYRNVPTKLNAIGFFTDSAIYENHPERILDQTVKFMMETLI
jgi:thymidylate kinase